MRKSHLTKIVRQNNLWIFLFSVILLFSIKIQAESFVLQEWQTTYNLQPFTEIAPDKIGAIPTGNITNQLSKLPFQKLGQQDFTLEANQYYWGKFELQNNLPEAAKYKEWILDMSYSLT